MGAYFNIDPVLFRILFVMLVFLGAGISIIIYIILWIVAPVATTTAQRLETRGEEPTIQNIKKAIQEEVKEVAENIKKLHQSEAMREGKKAAREAFKSFGTGLTEAFSSKKNKTPSENKNN